MNVNLLHIMIDITSTQSIFIYEQFKNYIYVYSLSNTNSVFLFLQSLLIFPTFFIVLHLYNVLYLIVWCALYMYLYVMRKIWDLVCGWRFVLLSRFGFVYFLLLSINESTKKCVALSREREVYT